MGRKGRKRLGISRKGKLKLVKISRNTERKVVGAQVMHHPAGTQRDRSGLQESPQFPASRDER